MGASGHYCPVAEAADVVGDRWSLLVLREMISGATRFNEIQRGLPGISRSLLVQRLRHLAGRGVVDAVPLVSGRGNEYHLTAAGRDLAPVVAAVAGWGARWLLDEPSETDLDPHFLVWAMHRRVNLDRVPERRTVMRFDVLHDKRDVIWMLLSPDEVSVCRSDPGFEVDVHITVRGAALLRVWAGWSDLADELEAGRVVVAGRPALVRRWPSWFAWAPYRDVVRNRVLHQDVAIGAPAREPSGRHEPDRAVGSRESDDARRR